MSQIIESPKLKDCPKLQNSKNYSGVRDSEKLKNHHFGWEYLLGRQSMLVSIALEIMSLLQIPRSRNYAPFSSYLCKGSKFETRNESSLCHTCEE